MARRVLLRALFAPLFAFAGCNAVLGISDDPILPGAGIAEGCVLNSDCPEGLVCLFELCSEPCSEDRDCDEGARCLQTELGTACAKDSITACSRNGDCPEGTICAGEDCRNECSEESVCLADQACDSESICRGTDPTRDPPGGSSGGSGGSGGSGAGEEGGAGGSAGSSAGTVCEPSETDCRDGGLVICDENGAWSEPVSCPFVCADGQCAGECVPDTKTCSMGRAHTCGSDGYWDQGELCPVLCDQGHCATSCTNGNKSCDDLIPQTCVEGAWDNGEPCAFVCKAGACIGSCEPGEEICTEDGDLQTCDADGEPDVFDCPATCIDEECAGECVPETFDCVDNNHFKVCDELGQYPEQAESCGNKACYQDACVGECKPDTRVCVTGNKIEECQDDGEYAPFQSCSGPAEICRNGACVTNSQFTVGISNLTSTYAISSGSIYLVRVQSTVNASVKWFGFGRNSKATTSANLTLYSDVSGKPGSLLAWSSSLLNFGSSGNAEVGVSPANTTLAKDTYYWIGVEVNQTNCPVYGRSQSGAALAYQYPSMFAANPSPLDGGNLIDLVNVELNLYLLVQEIPN